MKRSTVINDHTVTLDPGGAFGATPPNRLSDACGLLLPWGVTATSERQYKDTLLANYPFYMGEMTGGVINRETLAYQYPEDPDLFPIAKVEHPEITETLLIYQYGIIGVLPDNPTAPAFITRMD